MNETHSAIRLITKCDRTLIPAMTNCKSRERDKWKKDCFQVLKEIGLSDNYPYRGLSPSEIQLRVGYGSKNQIREILQEMVDEEIIWRTGITKSIRYVIIDLKNQAEEIYRKEQEKRK